MFGLPNFQTCPVFFNYLLLLFGLQFPGISFPATSLHLFCYEDRCAAHEHWKCILTDSCTMLQRHIKHLQAVDLCNLHRQWWSGMWFSTIHQTSSPRKYNWLQLASVSQITNCLYRQPSKQRHNKKQLTVPVRRKSAKWGKISPWLWQFRHPAA